MRKIQEQQTQSNPKPTRRATISTIRLMVGVAAVVLVGFLPPKLWSEEAQTRPVSEIPWKERTKFQQNFEARYDELHTPRSTPGRTNYMVDQYDWVVTSEFAERYGFPREMIDDSIQGAIAVAFRIYEGNNSCSILNGSDFCIANVKCDMDYYFDNEKNKIPWLNDTQRFVFIRALGSFFSLPRRVDDITAKNHNSFTLFDDLESKEGLPLITTRGTILFFDRNFGPNMTVISIRNCPETQDDTLKGYRLGFFASKEKFLSQRKTIVSYQFSYHPDVKYDYTVVLPQRYTDFIQTKFAKMSRDVLKNNKTIQSVIDKYSPKQK